jgi:hypothetical protein
LHNIINFLPERAKSATATCRRGPHSVIFPACIALPDHCGKNKAIPSPVTEPDEDSPCVRFMGKKEKTPSIFFVASNAQIRVGPQSVPSLQDTEQQGFSPSFTLNIATLHIPSKAKNK